MSQPFQVLDVLSDSPSTRVFGKPMRILSISKERDSVWLIPMPGPDTEKPTRTKSYLPGPKEFSLAAVQEHFDAYRLLMSKYVAPPSAGVPDAIQLENADGKKAELRLKRKFDDRDRRWGILLPLLQGPNGARVRSFDEIISDDSLPGQIEKRAKEVRTSVGQIYKLLHLYWARGSQKNALLTAYDRCGGHGQKKAQRRKLGRQTRLFKNGEVSSSGYVLTEDCKDKLRVGYKLISKKTGPMAAFLLTSSAYWAHHEVDGQGLPTSRLYPRTQRPSIKQFLYWGKSANNNQSVTEILSGKKKWRTKTRANGGSLQDQVTTVGQLAVFDSTSTDVYLTSFRSRLIKLPPMTRYVLKEVRTEVVLGFHCSWDAPSPATALETILHGASSKVKFCKQFDIDITDDDWPFFLPRTILADNGELKGDVPTQAEEQFSFSIDYAETNGGDRKGGVESHHHADHKRLDHRLPGTTHGKQRERGDDHPAVNALWNYSEYMHEYILEVLRHNNEEASHLAPVAMLSENPPIKPTRLNILKWLRAKGMSVEIPCDSEAMRAFMLPDFTAVVRKDGVHLMAKVLGHNIVVPRLRYMSDELLATGLLTKVKTEGVTIKTTLKMDGADLTQAWLPTKIGMIKLQCCADDMHGIPLIDWLQHIERSTLNGDLNKETMEQEATDKEERRAAKTAKATRELKAEISQLKKAPSKASLTKHLMANQEAEIALLRQQHQEATAIAKPAKSSSKLNPPPPTKPTQAADAMEKLNAQEFPS
ncbi:MAG: hypothetical protein Q7K57_55860 [Burkholderiaceae bacterium]|nr:hypothetical protein [Burkholderiaceae bacterium]